MEGAVLVLEIAPHAVEMDRMVHHRIVDQHDPNTLSVGQLQRLSLGEFDPVECPGKFLHVPGQVQLHFAAGLAAVGVVEQGPDDLLGRRTFCLYPHQDRYVVPVDALTVIPDDVPSRRAVLAGPVETALNALWDAPPCIGDRIAVIGGGMIGASLAVLLSRFPLGRLQLVDTDPVKRDMARAMGIEAVEPEALQAECDIIYHASTTEAGLAQGLERLGDEGELVELSWFGSHVPAVPLGTSFHARRLRITASQVSTIGRARRYRRTHAARMDLVMHMLQDPVFDALISGESGFADLPGAIAGLAQGELPTLCRAIRYPDPGPRG